MYIRKGITIDREHCCSISNAQIELLGVSIKNAFGRRLNLLGLYKPPRGNCNEFLAILEDAIKNTRSSFRGEIAILGDFNINVSSNDKPSQDLAKMCGLLGLSQVISDPTRLTNHSATCLDLIITDIEWVHMAGVVDSSISDHFPVFLCRKKDRLEKKVTEIRFRDFDLEAFREDLCTFNTTTLLDSDANASW